MAISDKYEMLDALLDTASLRQRDWVTSLQEIRRWTDAAYDEGSIAEYQWRALVTRSAKIQDMKNGNA